MTWARLLERVGAEGLVSLFAEADLVALVNWTMIPAMSAIWGDLLSLLAARPVPQNSTRRFFFDLADPEKHDDPSVVSACRLLARFQEHGPTMLGLNEKEAFRVGRALGYAANVDGPFIENPLISTGAGDHFNAGFCLAKQLGLTDDEAATAAVGTSGYYVRHAVSPSLPQLAEFLDSQSAGE